MNEEQSIDVKCGKDHIDDMAHGSRDSGFHDHRGQK